LKNRFTNLVQLVNGRADGPEHVGLDSADLEDAIEDLSVVDLDDEVTDVQRRQNFGNDLHALHVRNHWVVLTGDVEILK
jgi:hypothetical protein